jgi:diguanylate cyclase (GGDEF)-like protein/PAS domain S-box-containing protein
MVAIARSVAGVLFVLAVSAVFQLGPGLLGLGEATAANWATAGWIIASSLAGALCVTAALKSQGPDRQAWANLGAGCVLWAAGTLAWSSDNPTLPHLGDAAYIVACLFFVAGLLRYGVGRQAIGWLKGTEFAISSCAVSLALLIALHDTLEDSVLSSAATAVAFLKPASWFAVAAFGLLCLGLNAASSRRPAMRLLVIAAVLHACADLPYGIAMMTGSYEVGATYDALWVAAYLTVSWAALEHMARAIRSFSGELETGRRWPVEALVPAVAVLIIASAWLVTAGWTGTMLLTSAAAALALPALIGVREHLMIRRERQLKAAADASREELSSVLESTTDSVIVLDRNWNLTYVNGRATSLFGNSGMRPGANLWKLFPEEVGGPFETAYRNSMETQEAYQLEGYLAKHGKWLEVHGQPSPDKLTIFFRDITDRRRASDKIERLAKRDALTGLFNRVVFREKLSEKAGAGAPVAVIMLDLDKFKEVNDTHGHPVGDELLVQFGERVSGCASDALLARLGGDEFALVVDGGRKEAEDVADRIVWATTEPYQLSVGSIEVGASMGIACAPENGTDPDEVFKKADIALFRTKAEAVGRCRFFEPEMEAELLRMQALKADLAKALPRQQFATAYQPVVSLRDDRVHGFETLIRWRHPERGMVPPDEFIPVVEETGAIIEIGKWVLEKALASASTWPEPIMVAVNLSPCQFRGDSLLQTVRDALARSAVSPRRLELEITESVLLHGSDRNLSLLHSLRAMGVMIALDDFGVGYSSLAYLRTFPFTRVKIDRSFIKGIDANEEASAIVKSVVDIAAAMGMQVTAEGIETRQELDCIRGLGCNAAQGYFIGRPVPEGSELEALEKVNTDMIWRAPRDPRLPVERA